MKNNTSSQTQILLGILIPHFNDERIIFLLDKINKTSFRSEIKIFIQDAGSEENIIKKINTKLKSQDSLVVARDNGIFDGFNRLLKRVDTEYVTWLGADDFIDESFNYNEIHKLMTLNVDYIQCKLIYFNSSKLISRTVTSYSINYFKALFGVPFYHIGSILKTSIIKNELFSLEYPTASDFHFYLKILKKNSLESTPCDSSVVYIAEGGVSGKSFMARFKGLVQMVAFFKGYKIIILPIFILVRCYFKLKSISIRGGDNLIS